jgi:uncharacterized OB-fold protein
MCPKCQSLDWDHIESAGKGEIYSFVMPAQPTFAWMEYPYVVAIIALDEGTRLISNIVGVPPEQVSIGQRVEVCYDTFDPDGLVLPMFRLADGLAV